MGAAAGGHAAKDVLAVLQPLPRLASPTGRGLGDLGRLDELALRGLGTKVVIGTCQWLVQGIGCFVVLLSYISMNESSMNVWNAKSQREIEKAVSLVSSEYERGLLYHIGETEVWKEKRT